MFNKQACIKLKTNIVNSLFYKLDFTFTLSPYKDTKILLKSFVGNKKHKKESLLIIYLKKSIYGKLLVLLQYCLILNNYNYFCI